MAIAAMGTTVRFSFGAYNRMEFRCPEAKVAGQATTREPSRLLCLKVTKKSRMTMMMKIMITVMRGEKKKT